MSCPPCHPGKGERSHHPPLLPVFANLPHPLALLVTLLIFTVRVNGEVGLSTGILTYSRPGALAPLGRLAPLVGVGALPFPCGRRVLFVSLLCCWLLNWVYARLEGRWLSPQCWLKLLIIRITTQVRFGSSGFRQKQRARLPLRIRYYSIDLSSVVAERVLDPLGLKYNGRPASTNYGYRR